MDIAIASSPDSTNFTTLALVTDRYVHAQDYQKNYTAVIVSNFLPSTEQYLKLSGLSHIVWGKKIIKSKFLSLFFFNFKSLYFECNKYLPRNQSSCPGFGKSYAEP